jgi:N-acetyl-gamma-glutamyl-phosphate reductase
MLKIAIVGANGYTGSELLNILRLHPEAEIKYLTSQSNSGVPVTELYPGLQAYKNASYVTADYSIIGRECDYVFTALPHGAAAQAVADLHISGAKVIDLSADFRYDDLPLYESIYKVKHPAPTLKGVYGMPELFREAIRGADIVGNPGCYTTSAILPIYPLLKEGAVSSKDIIVDSASGTSGAGRKGELSLSYCEVNENFKAYSVGNHRHTSEIEEKLSIAAGEKVKVQFTPHLLPVQRGILSTIYLKPETGINAHTIREIYEAYYGREEFIIINPDGVLPSLNQIKYGNYCSIGFVMDERTGRLIVISALDNLVKGASGQAVQNMNIMAGLPESTGLKGQAHHI